MENSNDLIRVGRSRAGSAIARPILAIVRAAKLRTK